jgi:hypothetical protein
MSGEIDQAQEDDPPERQRQIDWQWIVTVLGLTLGALTLFSHRHCLTSSTAQAASSSSLRP